MMKHHKILSLAFAFLGLAVAAGISGVFAAEDTTPPSAVSNLSVATTTPTSVHLTWSAPSDGSATTTPASYDIRYRSDVPITMDNFATSTQATGEPMPSATGTVEHFTLTGLTASTTYWFGLKTFDNANNSSTLSNIVSTTTPAAADITPPTISNINVTDITPTSAKVNWTTNENAHSLVRYNTTTDYGLSATSSSLVTSHIMTLGSLTPATLYHFSVSSADSSGNTATSTDRTFMTLATSTPPTSTTTIAAWLISVPKSLKLNKTGKKFVVAVRLPSGTTFEGLDPDSIRLNGVVKPVDTDLRPWVWHKWGKFRRTLYVKFKADDIDPLVPADATTFKITVTGNIKAGTFKGESTVRVVDRSDRIKDRDEKLKKERERLEQKLKEEQEKLKKKQEQLEENFKKKQEQLNEKAKKLEERVNKDKDDDEDDD